MQDIQTIVERALTAVDQIADLLDKAGPAAAARTTALRAWREQRAEELQQLVQEIHKHTMAELQPVIQQQRDKHPQAARAIHLAAETLDDPAFAAEFTAVSALLGGGK